MRFTKPQKNVFRYCLYLWRNYGGQGGSNFSLATSVHVSKMHIKGWSENMSSLHDKIVELVLDSKLHHHYFVSILEVRLFYHWWLINMVESSVV